MNHHWLAGVKDFNGLPFVVYFPKSKPFSRGIQGVEVKRSGEKILWTAKPVFTLPVQFTESFSIARGNGGVGWSRPKGKKILEFDDPWNFDEPGELKPPSGSLEYTYTMNPDNP